MIWVFKSRNFLSGTSYGGFKVVRETAKRIYFEHFCGSNLSFDSGRGNYRPGEAFHYHNEYWLTTEDAERRRIGVVEDVEAFEALCAAHDLFDESIAKMRETADRQEEIIYEDYQNRISNIVSQEN